MSCYNWEHGTLKLSVAEYARFKKDFREGFNRLQKIEMAAATRHWEKFKTGPLPDFFDEQRQRFYKLWQKWKPEPRPNNPGWGTWEQMKRPRKPIRKDFPLANNKQTLFTFDEADITFKHDTREVSYNSGNNNHQVERAREHKVGKLFFRLLETVKWTRGTGGKLIGNDEYNQETDGEGGGGNYVTATYPRKGSKNLQRLFRLP